MTTALSFRTTRGRLRTPRAVVLRGWGVAVSVYLLAVFHRSSLGVAGLQAEHRFGISAGQLSTFVMLQLGVYALMQIPTGILVDRFGPRRLLVTAAVLMGIAQLAFAFAPSYPTALLARGLLGCGDALTFVSVLRFAAGQISPRRYPMVIAVTAVAGTIGNVAATIPLSIALSGLGWTPSFAIVGVVSILTGALVWAVLPRTATAPVQAMSSAEMRAKAWRVTQRVGSAWGRPGTRLGFWLHFAAMSSTTTFGVLWGFPYLVDALGFSRSEASATLLLSVLIAVSANPVIGWWTGKHPAHRVGFAVTVCVLTVVLWLVLLSLTAPPGWAVVGVVVVMSVGSPTSSIAFALARDYNRPQIVGTATGVVNVGGFAATVLMSLGIGWILDVLGDSPADYRVAMLFPVLVQALGAMRLAHWWRVVRSQALTAQHRGEAVPVAVVRRRWDLGKETDTEER